MFRGNGSEAGRLVKGSRSMEGTLRLPVHAALRRNSWSRELQGKYFFVPALEQSFALPVHERDHCSLPRTSPGRPKGAYLNPASAGFFFVSTGLLLHTVPRDILVVFVVAAPKTFKDWFVIALSPCASGRAGNWQSRRFSGFRPVHDRHRRPAA